MSDHAIGLEEDPSVGRDPELPQAFFDDGRDSRRIVIVTSHDEDFVLHGSFPAGWIFRRI